ncbi:MAG TPA: SDR family oxidoreductase [Candidatus Polarisedimenticolaceae bacterium]
MPDRALEGRRAVVCGSTQGIGLACAIAIAGRGAAVTLFSRDRERLEGALASLPGEGHRVRVADSRDTDAVRRAGREEAALGPVHVLVNNTGGPPGGAIVDATPEEFLEAFRSHLLASHVLVQAFLPGMKEARYGRILNVISTSVKQPIPGLGVSNTVRAAVASWAKTLSLEVGAHGITVNNLLPGYTRTQRLTSIAAARAGAAGVPQETILAGFESEVPAGRFGDPSELAALAAFLAGPEAGYVNGVSIPVDGGRTLAL